MKRITLVLGLVLMFLVACSTQDDSDTVKEEEKPYQINFSLNGEEKEVRTQIECLGKEQCEGKSKDTIQGEPEEKDWGNYLSNQEASTIEAGDGFFVELSFPEEQPDTLYFQSSVNEGIQEIENKSFQLEERVNEQTEYYMVTAIWGDGETEAVVQIPLIVEFTQGTF